MLTGRMRTARRWRVRAAAVTAAALATGWVGLLAATPARADVARSAEGWVLSDLNLYQAWAQTRGRGVTVAVIDSGVDPSVSDLQGSVITGPDYSGVDTPSSNPNWGVHGTWMGSLVAGHGHGPDDEDGILGAAPESTVLSIRVITDAGDPNYAQYQAESAAKGQSELAEAITYAVNNGAGVISMSLGYSAQSLTVRKALQYAYEHNVVVVASAGNSGTAAGAAGTSHAPYSFPANYPGVLGVGAVNESGQVSSFSSENLSVQVAAPGNQVPAQGRDGQYWYVSGTSPACALTAGVVALIKSVYPHLNDEQVISAITTSTTPSTRPPGGWDQQIGFGEVNAANALAAAAAIAKASPPPAGELVSSHFGGGFAAVPPVPIAPRGSAILVGYALLAIAGLGLVAFAASRLFSLGGGPNYAAADGPGPTWPAGPDWPDGPADPATPAGPGPDPYGRRPPDPTTRPPQYTAWDRPDAGAGPPQYTAWDRPDAGAGPPQYTAWDRPDAGAGPGPGSSAAPRPEPPSAGPSGWLTGAPSSLPRHAAPRDRGTGRPDQP
jgi:subtilisin family serine protease